MDIKTLLNAAHQILEEAGVDHALIGGLALGALGIQRFTNDVDFLVPGSERNQVKSEFAKHTYKVFFESEEVLQLEGPGNVDFVFANRELSQQMIKRAKKIPEIDIKCLGPEDLIALKIQAYKNDPRREFQDKADIQGLINQHKKLDWKLLKKYADLFDEWPALSAIRDKAK